MSGPFAPPRGMPQRLPMGQTRKPMGADRVPQTNEIPPPVDPRIRMAREQGVNPALIAQRPGYTPPPVRTLPRPVPQTRSIVPPEPIDGAVPPYSSRDGGRPGTPAIPLPRPRPAQAAVDVRTGDFTAPNNAGVLAAALANRAAALSGQPNSRAVPPTDPDIVRFEQGKRALAQAIADRAQPPGKAPRDVEKGDTSAPSDPTQPPSRPQPSTSAAPPATAPAANPPGARYVPSQEQSVYYTRDPNASTYPTGKGKKGKDKEEKPPVSNTEARGHNYGYYWKMGIDEHSGKGGANAALQQLIALAQSHPELITRDQDKILATAHSSPAKGGGMKNTDLNLPITEEAIRGRMEQRAAIAAARAKGEGGGSSQAPKTKKERAAAADEKAQSYLETMGAPVWEGNKMPTQADVDAGKQQPQAFAQKFPTYQAPIIQAETPQTQPNPDDRVPDEEED